MRRPPALAAVAATTVTALMLSLLPVAAAEAAGPAQTAGTVDAAALATAVTASDWRAGNIISDAVFYASNAMTAAQVQTFLNGQGASCAAGERPCLKDYRMTTPSKPAESSLCGAYTGATDETAAQIIAKVGQACGINPQVLLVLLQKETSLVTKTKPTTSNYNRATGFGCPDTGPGGTANCDTQYYGFFNQLYRAARQYLVYRNNPTRYAYQAGRVNTILYNPNTDCGTEQVFIENQATAGLYIYTPYVPNAAALANFAGTGDSCSAYGNRNFFRIFSNWFGSTQVPNMIGTANPDPNAPVAVRAHVQNVGWQGWVKPGETAGTSGKALRVEALQFQLPKPPASGSIECSAHVQNVGWTSYVGPGQTCGTSGRALRVEAVRLRLTGALADGFDLWYRVHVENVGWLDWARNDAMAGTAGMVLRVEAVQVQFVQRGSPAPGSTAAPSIDVGLAVAPHVADVGWTPGVRAYQLAGNVASGRPIEALRLGTRAFSSGRLECSAHVQNLGWLDWVGPGQTCGTTGRGLRAEGFQLRLTGDAAASFDVWYRANVQGAGWLGWASNGASAGSQGLARRMESVQVVILPRGRPAPGPTAQPFLTR